MTQSLLRAKMVTEKCARSSDTATYHKYNHINHFIWHLNSFAKQFFAIRLSAAELQQRIPPRTVMCDSMLHNCLQEYKLPAQLILAVFHTPQPTLQLTAAVPAPAPQDRHHQDAHQNQDTEPGQQLQKKLKFEAEKFVRPLPIPIKTVVEKIHNLPCYKVRKFTINDLLIANGIDTDDALLAKLGLPENSCITSALKGVCTRPSCLRNRIHTTELPTGFDTAGTVRLLNKLLHVKQGET